MTITPHLLAGAALATTTNNVFVAFLIGFLLHFILDAIPHVDPGTFHHLRIPGYEREINLETVHDADRPWPAWIYIFVIVEFIIIWSIVILFTYKRSDFANIIAGGLGAIAIDVFDNPIFRFALKWPVFRQLHWLHHRFHHNLPANKWYWGLPSVIIISGVSLWYLLKF